MKKTIELLICNLQVQLKNKILPTIGDVGSVICEKGCCIAYNSIFDNNNIGLVVVMEL